MHKILIVLSAMICLIMALPAIASETVNDAAAVFEAENAQITPDNTGNTVDSTVQEQTAHEEVLPEETQVNTWYELTRDEMGADVLTVRFPSNPSTGFSWIYSISDPAMLELLTQEYIQDEQSGIEEGRGGTWVASFRNFSGTAGNVTLALGYGRTWEEEPIELHVLDMEINEQGQISIAAVDPGENLHDFYNPDGYDLLRVTNVFTGDDGLPRIQASFGYIGENGEFVVAEDESSYLLTVLPECTLMLPEDFDNPIQNIQFPASLEQWYSKARAAWALEGSLLDFYAAFEMNEAAEITRLAYVYLP